LTDRKNLMKTTIRFALTLMMTAVLSSQSANAQETKTTGDAAAGHKKAAMCIGCHGIVGYQASFPQVYKVPMISGQGPEYIVAALTAYRSGERAHPTMRAISGSLTDQDMADLAAYYGSHKAPAASATVPQPSAEVAALLKKGNCASCHGENFNKPIAGSYPKLAGQHADYLYAAMVSYQVGSIRSVGRTNAIMAAQAKPFTHQDVKAITEYIASLPSDLTIVSNAKFR
jgi:cytochrome c553